MWTALLSLMLLSPQLAPATVPTSPVRIERLTPDEQKQLKESNAEVADAAKAKADAASKAQEANKTDATTQACSERRAEWRLRRRSAS